MLSLISLLLKSFISKPNAYGYLQYVAGTRRGIWVAAAIFIGEYLGLLRESGAVLRRSKKHRHFVFPNGRVWIVPNSPKSDSGYYHNLADLKKYLSTSRRARS